MLYRTQAQIDAFYDFVIRKVAERKNISSVDFMSALEILDVIEQVDQNTHAKLGHG